MTVMSPTVQADSHRGKVVQALSEHDWMDCYKVANELSWSVDSASSVLSDVYRAGYVERRGVDRGRVDYEYRLKNNIRLG